MAPVAQERPFNETDTRPARSYCLALAHTWPFPGLQRPQAARSTRTLGNPIGPGPSHRVGPPRRQGQRPASGAQAPAMIRCFYAYTPGRAMRKGPWGNSRAIRSEAGPRGCYPKLGRAVSLRSPRLRHPNLGPILSTNTVQRIAPVQGPCKGHYGLCHTTLCGDIDLGLNARYRLREGLHRARTGTGCQQHREAQHHQPIPDSS